MKIYKKKLKKKWKKIKSLIMHGVENGMNYKKNEINFKK